MIGRIRALSEKGKQIPLDWLPNCLLSNNPVDAALNSCYWSAVYRTQTVLEFDLQSFIEYDGQPTSRYGDVTTACFVPLLHDIFGNPFRPVAFDPRWQTSTAVGLARTMYDARDFGAMPILADALQDAGCEDDAILNHCRDPQQVHVRGCWVVDLVLGKS